MAASATVLTDQTTLSRFDVLYLKLERFLTLIGGIVILLLVFLAVTNILGRWIFNFPVNGYIDWVEQAMAFMAFLGLAFTQRQGGHIRMDIVVGALKGRVLWFAEFLGVFLMLLITGILIYGSWDHAFRAISLGDSTVDINLPTWPTKILFPILFLILSQRISRYNHEYS